MRNKVKVAGLDPSLTSFGVAVVWIEDGKLKYETKRLQSSNLGASVRNRMRRFHELGQRVLNYLDEFKPRVVLIEHYAYASNLRGVSDRCEFGGILRSDLCTTDYIRDLREIQPTSLKKFVCGKGNAVKTDMVTKIATDHDLLGLSEDEYEAFGLALIAAVSCGIIPAKTRQQREVMDQVFGPLCWGGVTEGDLK